MTEPAQKYKRTDDDTETKTETTLPGRGRGSKVSSASDTADISVTPDSDGPEQSPSAGWREVYWQMSVWDQP